MRRPALFPRAIPVVCKRAEYDDGITFACVTQVLPDLMTGPGRGPAEAETLLD